MDEIELVREEDCAPRGPEKHVRLTDDEKKLLKESRKAIEFMEKLKTSLIRDEIKRMGVEDGIAKANKMAEDRDRRLALIHNGHSVDEANRIVKQEREDANRIAMQRREEVNRIAMQRREEVNRIAREEREEADRIAREEREEADRIAREEREETEAEMKKRRQLKPSEPRLFGVEKRVVCGKARSCELKDGVVHKVYDIKTKIWLPLDEFKNKYENIKADVGEEVKVEAPKITVTTSTSGISSSGTATMIPDIKTNTVSVPENNKIGEEKTNGVKVEEEKKIEERKIENKSEKKVEHANIIDEYISLLYMNG